MISRRIVRTFFHASVLVASLSGLGPLPLAAQTAGQAGRVDTEEPLPLQRLSGPIEVDGVVDEPAWDEVEPLRMSMYTPTFGAPLTERTEIRIAYDDRYLYVSGRLYDTEPDEIRTNTFYRDQYSGDDLLAVVIDSYNDYETAVWFVTNPAGNREDRTISNDAEFTSGMPMNADWNSHWEVATTETDEGWFAEMRIPFSTLGFQSIDGRVTMGLIAYRFIPRKNERQLFPAISPDWGPLGFAKPSRARRVTLDGVKQSTPVYVTPYGLGGVQQTPVLRSPPDVPMPGWRTENDRTSEAGFDLRFSPTSNLTLDVTANTDFAQVEADQQQINLTRFSLFFPEKRQFFQERASTFNFNTGGFFNRLFHSRRIGLANGETVRIYGGARAVGRIGGMDFGLLDMQTAAQGGRSTENLGVLRVNQQILNPYSSIGAMVTSRQSKDGKDNLAYGIDAVLRPVGDEYITLKWAQTIDDVVVEESTLSAGLIQARWTRRKDAGFSYFGEYLRVGDDFVPRLGFQLRRDFWSVGGRTQYKWFHGAESPLRSAGFNVATSHFYRIADGSAESRAVTPEFFLEFKGGTQLRINSTTSYESVRRPFFISKAEVPVGDYWFSGAQARLEFPRADKFRGDFTANAGRFYDGERIGVALNPTWNLSKYVELGAGYEVNRITFAERGVETTTHLARLKVSLALDTKLSFSTFAQYSNVADLTTFNARFRYNFAEGTDLWLVYNEGLNTVRANGLDPRLPLSAGRNFTVKYSHTLIW
jgi:Domain of unknown function (DUF5916)/Carbohydrate family 9 binding domain-like